MQLQSLMLMLLLMIIFPLMILTSNNDVFFIVLTLVLLFASVRNLHELLFTGSNQPGPDEDDADSEELEEFLGLDIHKLETGFYVVKNLIIILYLAYCSFYIDYNWIKYFIFTIALYWICDIILTVQDKIIFKEYKLLKRISSILINVSILSIIILAAYNKLIVYNL